MVGDAGQKASSRTPASGRWVQDRDGTEALPVTGGFFRDEYKRAAEDSAARLPESYFMPFS